MNFDEPVQGHLHWNDGEYKDGRKEVLKTIVILSVITVAEVSIAISYDKLVPGGQNRWIINLLMAIFSVIKVVYIMGTFMHLRHEKKGFILTCLLPFLFLVWAIIAFTFEGSSWQAMRHLLNAF
jgi:cytochrome c oxidase subunit 4